MFIDLVQARTVQLGSATSNSLPYSVLLNLSLIAMFFSILAIHGSFYLSSFVWLDAVQKNTPGTEDHGARLLSRRCN